MRLKTTTDASDASQEALLRRGFEDRMNEDAWSVFMRLGGDKPGEVYEAWFPRGYRFEDRMNEDAWSVFMRLGGDKPGEVYEAWFPRGYRWGYFVRIHKGTVAAYKTSSLVDWDYSQDIILILV